ncbi:MAG: lytic transglycosylase [Alphaproteobacteria bacterium]|nr:MAG: lytic transglycosylase [Alphaproteobacteria bacterium]
MNGRSVALAAFVAGCVCAFPLPLAAAPCGGDFSNWIEIFKREAAVRGVSPRALASLSGVTPDPKVIALDRRQGVFRKTFEEFGLPRIAQRLPKAARLLRQHAATLSRIERQFGVPGEVVVAIWGLETDFGAVMGRQSVIRSVATLAHDCRRTERFQGELLDVLRIVDRGDYAAEDLRGAWAGEIGQTQFLPSSFMKYAVDFDGNGRRDLIRSVPDVLASTANYLRAHGWRRGEPYGEGTANFAVLKEWNKSPVYQKTIAAFAERLARAE